MLLGISALWLLALAGQLLFFEHQSRSYKFVTDASAHPLPVVRNEQRGISPEAPRASSLRLVP